jgi:hypothetical protein
MDDSTEAFVAALSEFLGEWDKKVPPADIAAELALQAQTYLDQAME